MSRPRHNPVTDANHKLVSELFRRIGYHYRGYRLGCLDISKVGGKRTDWIIAVGSENVFIEIKTPEAYRKPNYGLTDGENDFFNEWPGEKYIVDSETRLLKFMDVIIDRLCESS